MNEIIFEKAQGGLGRPLPGKDHVCGLLVYSNTVPAGYVDTLVKEFRSLAQVQAAGITEGDAEYGVIWYHAKEFFRLHKKGILWLYFAAVPVALDFTEIIDMQLQAEGDIRKVGVYVTHVAFDTDHVIALQAVKETLDTQHMPVSIIYAPEISDVEDMTTLPDLATLDSEGVSVFVGQDGDAVGSALFASTGKTVSSIGAVLGAWSYAKVSESIGWVAKFPMSDGTENKVPAFGNGQVLKSLGLTLPDVLDDLDEKRYMFFRKHVGSVNTYIQETHCATAITSDFSHIERNTTIDKAIREMYAKILPEFNGPVLVDAQTGQLDNDYIEHLKSLGDQALAEMAKNFELSGYQTVIDPSQDVNATDEIEISIEQVGVGVARKFKIKIGYVKQLS